METKLYIGNMSFDTTEDELRSMFSQAGTVEAVDIIKDRDTGRSRGFGFITMNNQAEAEKAISMFNGTTITDRALTVNIARPREERQNQGGYRSGPTHRSRGGAKKRY
jgi:RNA recognition motif-containing protein